MDNLTISEHQPTFPSAYNVMGVFIQVVSCSYGVSPLKRIALELQMKKKEPLNSLNSPSEEPETPLEAMVASLVTGLREDGFTGQGSDQPTTTGRYDVNFVPRKRTKKAPPRGE